MSHTTIQVPIVLAPHTLLFEAAQKVTRALRPEPGTHQWAGLSRRDGQEYRIKVTAHDGCDSIEAYKVYRIKKSAKVQLAGALKIEMQPQPIEEMV
jgi:hypothetical protein